MGLEPTHLSILEPKSSAATNYAKGAKHGARGRNRTGTPLQRQILNLLWLPITPLEHSLQLYANTLLGGLVRDATTGLQPHRVGV